MLNQLEILHNQNSNRESTVVWINWYIHTMELYKTQYSYENEWTATENNMDESHKYNEWKKATIKE